MRAIASVLRTCTVIPKRLGLVLDASWVFLGSFVSFLGSSWATAAAAAAAAAAASSVAVAAPAPAPVLLLLVLLPAWIPES